MTNEGLTRGRAGWALASSIAAGVLALALVSAAAPAYAAPIDHNGWSQTEFVNAAAKLGVPRATAVRAYNDPELFRSVPVSIGSGGSTSTPAITERAAAPAFAGGSAFCYYGFKNAVGSWLVYLRVTKSWSTSGSNVVPGSVVYYQEGNLGWSFQGIIGSQDYYGTYGGSTKGKHSSNRIAKFHTDLGIPADSTVSVTTTGQNNGGHTCGGSGSYPL